MSIEMVYEEELEQEEVKGGEPQAAEKASKPVSFRLNADQKAVVEEVLLLVQRKYGGTKASALEEMAKLIRNRILVEDGIPDWSGYLNNAKASLQTVERIIETMTASYHERNEFLLEQISQSQEVDQERIRKLEDQIEEQRKRNEALSLEVRDKENDFQKLLQSTREMEQANQELHEEINSYKNLGQRLEDTIQKNESLRDENEVLKARCNELENQSGLLETELRQKLDNLETVKDREIEQLRVEAQTLVEEKSREVERVNDEWNSKFEGLDIQKNLMEEAKNREIETLKEQIGDLRDNVEWMRSQRNEDKEKADSQLNEVKSAKDRQIASLEEQIEDREETLAFLRKRIEKLEAGDQE